jgi:gentisate 1,2-dioxygenase
MNLFLATVNQQYVLLPQESDPKHIPRTQIRSFDGHGQSLIVNKTMFSGHFNDEFIIRMWMKHTNDDDNNDKHHIFCKSDEKREFYS